MRLSLGTSGWRLVQLKEDTCQVKGFTVALKGKHQTLRGFFRTPGTKRLSF